MRRLLISLLALSTLLAAAPPKTSMPPAPKAAIAPKASPSPSPTPKPSGPKVLLYPLESTASGLPKTAGATVAEIFSKAFEASGGLRVLPSPPATLRNAYPATAARLGAAYYISGYITPIGSGISVLEQVVNVSNGVIIYSKTEQVFGVNDAAAMALNARRAILADAGVGSEYTPSTTTSTPAPVQSGPAGQAASVKITGISSVLGRLFGKHAAAVAVATPKPNAKPSRRALVVRVHGALSAGQLTTATDLLYAQLNIPFNAMIVPAPPGPIATDASTICGDNRDTTILTGRMEELRGHFPSRGSTTFYLRAYACFGALLYHGHANAGTAPAAIKRAVDAYVAAHPDND